MLKKIKGLFVEEQGQGMTEYGLVLGVIAVGVVGILFLFKEEIYNMFQTVLNSVQNRNNAPTP